MHPTQDPEHEAWVRQALADFERPLLAYATRLLGNVESGRDLVQETFLRLCRARRADLEQGLRGWLYTVCRNGALDLLRKERRMGSLDEEHAQEVPSRDAAHTAAIEQHDELQQILALLATLPSKQREVLRLKFQHGLSYAEIARVTQQKEGTVGWLIHEGIGALRARLEPDGIPGVRA